MSDAPDSQTMFDEADEFTRAYVVAALTLMEGDEDLPEDFVAMPSDVAPESMRRMIADCAEFQRIHGDVIEEAVEPRRFEQANGSSARELAGNDFWLTRTGQGAGFWDGDWVEPHATAMDDTCEDFGNQDMVLGDDGKIYAEGGKVLETTSAPAP